MAKVAQTPTRARVKAVDILCVCGWNGTHGVFSSLVAMTHYILRGVMSRTCLASTKGIQKGGWGEGWIFGWKMDIRCVFLNKKV